MLLSLPNKPKALGVFFYELYNQNLVAIKIPAKLSAKSPKNNFQSVAIHSDRSRFLKPYRFGLKYSKLIPLTEPDKIEIFRKGES